VCSPFISNIPSYINRFFNPIFQAKINDTPYVIEGTTKPLRTPSKPLLDINIKNLGHSLLSCRMPLRKWILRLSQPFGYPDKTLFYWNGKIRSLWSPSRETSPWNNCGWTMERTKPLLRLPLLDISMLHQNQFLKSFIFKNLPSVAWIGNRRDEKGVANVQTLFPETKETKPAPKKSRGISAFNL